MSEETGTRIRGQRTAVIDGLTYTSTPLPAREGLEVMRRLSAAAGQEALMVFFAMNSEAREAALSNPGIKAGMFSQFCENADDMSVLSDMMRLTTCDKIQIGDTTVEGNVEKHFDSHFAGRYQHLMKVVQFVGEVNFEGP